MQIYVIWHFGIWKNSNALSINNIFCVIIMYSISVILMQSTSQELSTRVALIMMCGGVVLYD